MNKSLLSQVNILILTCLLTSCGFVAGQIKDKAHEERLLKPGALDGEISIPAKYPRYQFRFLDKYQISHDWYGWNGCRYASRYNGDFYAVTDIFETDNHTWQLSSKPGKPFNIDRYTRPEWTVSGYQGKPVTNTGFTPICSQSWLQTQHVLAIELRKQSAEELISIYKKIDPDVVFTPHQINQNKWLVKVSELRPTPPLNGAGGPFQTWILPIADTGYIFIFVLGANQESLKYPEAHAQIQQIFKHLIESVRIEPLVQ